MDILSRAIEHISETARVPSFSSYEERLHPHIHGIFSDISRCSLIDVPGNNLVYHIRGKGNKTVGLTAHLDKINHYGQEYPNRLPVKIAPQHIEGAMDNSLGVGVLLTMAELTEHIKMPNLLFLFSEMEESKGLKEHPKLLKNGGEGYKSGMGAKRIARKCIELNCVPDEVITVDTTPLFKGDPGIALYSKHWEINNLEPSKNLTDQTEIIEKRFKTINENIKLDNNTNDYLHYGEEFNKSGAFVVPSVALEPAIYPYHQKGECIFISDLKKVLNILKVYLSDMV